MRVLVAIVVLSAGCSKKESAKPAEPAPRPAPAPSGPPAFDRLPGKIVVSGEGELDDRPGLDRWARLDIDAEHGAYAIETNGAALVAQYDLDGRTQPWVGWAGAKAIPHQQGHRAGYRRWELAVRGGTVVVLREESVDDARANEAPVVRAYADASGVCATPCPKASEHGFTVSEVPGSIAR
jgi:hypothetical protein